MTAKKLKLGLVGLGNMGSEHVKTLMQMKNVEIVGENGKLTLCKNEISMLKLIETSKKSFDSIAFHTEEIPYKNDAPSGHKVVIEQFVKRALGEDCPLIADGTEGLNSVAIANGIMLSHFKQRPVQTSTCGDEFELKLKSLIASSKFVKHVSEPVEINMEDSFSR